MNERPFVPPAPAPRVQRSSRRRVVTALKWLVTLGAFAFLLARQPLADLLAAVAQVSPVAVIAAILVLCSAVTLGTWRWALLMRAYGATSLPSARTLLYYNWVGFFYNTYVPGGIGGDVVRGIAVKDVFPGQGAARSLAIVFIERVLGLAGMLTLVGCAYVVFPIPALKLPGYVALLGPASAVAALLAVSAGRRMAARMPGKLGQLFDALPPLTRHAPMAVSFVLSVLNHLLIALAGHLLMTSLSDVPTFAQSLVAVPLSAATVFLPVSVAGMGVRDTAFVALYELLGVDRAIALAGALTMLVCNLAAAALGGLWQLVSPLPPSARAAVDAERPAPPPPP